MMVRTQISLTDADRRVLDAAAARTGRSIAALIRDAVQSAYGTERSSAQDFAVMRKAFGSWREHQEDGAEMVERLRSGSRLSRS